MQRVSGTTASPGSPISPPPVNNKPVRASAIGHTTNKNNSLPFFGASQEGGASQSSSSRKPPVAKNASSWPFAAGETGESEKKKLLCALPAETRTRRKIDWNDKGFLLALIKAGLGANSDDWLRMWTEFTRSRSQPIDPPTSAMPRNLLQEFVEQNLYIARQAPWADNLLFEKPGETELPWTQISEPERSPSSSSDNAPEDEAYPKKEAEDEEEEERSPPKAQLRPSEEEEEDNSSSSSDGGESDDENEGFASDENEGEKQKKKRKRKLSRREEKEKAKKKKKKEKERRDKERRDKERERREKERKEKEMEEKKGRERKRRRMNMIGFSDAEESGNDEPEPTIYHRVSLCPMRHACPHKRTCAFAHNEKELMGIGEAKKLYDIKHNRLSRHPSAPFDPLAVKHQKLEQMQKNPMYKTSSCPYVSPGRLCHFGANCFYAHSPSELRPAPINSPLAASARIPPINPLGVAPNGLGVLPMGVPPMNMMGGFPPMSMPGMNPYGAMNQYMMMAMMNQQSADGSLINQSMMHHGGPQRDEGQVPAEHQEQHHVLPRKRNRIEIRDDDL